LGKVIGFVLEKSEVPILDSFILKFLFWLLTPKSSSAARELRRNIAREGISRSEAPWPVIDLENTVRFKEGGQGRSPFGIVCSFCGSGPIGLNPPSRPGQGPDPRPLRLFSNCFLNSSNLFCCSLLKIAAIF
jgi:hypothetical protein